MLRHLPRALPVFATRDWHPPNHCSFKAQGGIWPPHCVAATSGAEFAPGLALPSAAVIISKAATPDADSYSGFGGTDLAARLRSGRATRLFIGGLATDYCVLNTVKDALAAGFEVLLLADAVRAVDVNAGDGARAQDEMQRLGARTIRYEDLAP
jgi:nicotinamidase/pyrazinamidase